VVAGERRGEWTRHGAGAAPVPRADTIRLEVGIPMSERRWTAPRPGVCFRGCCHHVAAREARLGLAGGKPLQQARLVARVQSGGAKSGAWFVGAVVARSP